MGKSTPLPGSGNDLLHWLFILIHAKLYSIFNEW